MKKFISVLAYLVVGSSVSIASNPTKVLRQAKATVFISKEWHEIINNEMVLKSEKVCEKTILSDVIEYKLDPNFEYNPQKIECESFLKEKKINLVVIPQIMETSVGATEIPLLPPNSRVKLISGFFMILPSDSEIKVQPMLNNYFMTEDLGLKTAYIYLAPHYSSTSSTSCDDKGKCKTDFHTDGPDVVFNASLKIEDNL